MNCKLEKDSTVMLAYLYFAPTTAFATFTQLPVVDHASVMQMFEELVKSLNVFLRVENLRAEGVICLRE